MLSPVREFLAVFHSVFTTLIPLMTSSCVNSDRHVATAVLGRAGHPPRGQVRPVPRHRPASHGRAPSEPEASPSTLADGGCPPWPTVSCPETPDD